MGYQYWSYEKLHQFCMDAFQKFGFSEKEADIIQDVLLTLRQLARDGAATAYTPRTYITCPCCGEDTIPDSYGCCEYCGEVICE